MKAAAPVIAAPAVGLSAARFSDYAALFRLRVAVMVLVTVAFGALLASVGPVPVDRLIHVVIGTGLVTAAASALNQWIERDIDVKMRRTADRPLPSGRLSPAEVFGLGGALAALGFLYQLVALPPAACVVTAFTFVSYLAVYTPSKRVTPLNTLIGAVPGALPPVIGWTAVRGEFDAGAVVLFLIVFFWQVPHFLAIAWMYREEYGRAGHKMLTVGDATGEFTARQMLLYLVALVPVTLLAVPVLHAGAGYAAGALLLALYWLRPVLAFGRDRDRATAKRVLRASIVYLPGLFALLLVAHYVPNF